MTRLKHAAAALVLLLLACILVGVSVSLVSKWTREVQGSVAAVRVSKQTVITVATAEGEVDLPFDRDDEAACPKGARFDKPAWSAAMRCNGKSISGAGSSVMWWIGAVVGFLFAGVAAGAGVSYGKRAAGVRSAPRAARARAGRR